jgi:hypothetical protein
MEINQRVLRGLVDSEVPNLSDYSIGFVLPKMENGSPDARLGGSGTLVMIDEIYGILTASHVIKLLKTSEYTGLVLPTVVRELHNLSFKTDDCSCISFCPQGAPVNGPDIGILIPPPDALVTLQARKSFYNLSKRQQRMLEKPEPLGDGFWILSGFAGEWSGDGPPEQGFSRVKYFKGMHAEGKVTTACSQENFDYLFLEALYNEFYEGPESYGGFSGGGLWQLLLTANGNKLKVADRLLSGVAFYQSEKKRDDAGRVIREIKCHGRRSIYEAMIDRVRAQHS